MKLAGFNILDVIYSVDETVVARAEAANGNQLVLKYQNTSHPSLDLIARWRHEHDILQGISSEWVIKSYGLQQVDAIQVLLLEYFSSSNLAQLLEQRQLTLAERLLVAIQLVTALSDVHKFRLVHGDIAAKNVLIDPVSLKIKLCDFGLASRLDNEQKNDQESYLRGTLEYISPEQTGRTNLAVDYRSDFYSLGVTLYELFLGRKPFVSDDPMALLHCHLALMPTPIHHLDPSLPVVLSDIVQKLLAKFPDDRYQSSHGLKVDLQNCLQQWQSQQQIKPFVLATADVPERLCLANKLYGREREIEALLAAFERVSVGHPELMLVSGYAGIGKSALVNQLHKPVVARRACFIKGKCEQFSRNQPYAALVQAFQPLLRQLMSEGAERQSYWKNKLLHALGDNAGVLTALFPNLALLIGPPPALPALPVAEMENRFHIAFSQLLGVLASPQQPLVLFLDDLQWVDLPTLRLLQQQFNADSEACLLVAGAYRDNEVDEGHPLAQTVAAIRQAGGVISRLQLDNLTFAHLSQLIADALRCSNDKVAPLAALCWEKTQGNPFFLRQFLSTLYDNGDIVYSRSHGAWAWHIEAIQQRNMTDNVVDLMLGKLRRLEPEAQSLLSQAAHLGNRFDMVQLCMVSELEVQAAAAALWPALRDGLIVPLNDAYKFAHTPEKLAQARYRFLHDRVQQAAYSLTPEQQRQQLQLRTGRLLLAHTPPSQLEERLFGILEQLNSALPLIDDAAERAQLLTLNLRGGIKAKAASAYSTAVSLLRVAKSLLTADAWQQWPEQTLSLYKELAETEYLNGDFAAAEALYPQGLAGAADAQAKVTLCLVQAEQYLIQGRFAESFPVLRFALELLGGSFPASDEEAGQLFPQEFEKAEQLLARQSHAALLKAPEMTQPEHLLQMRIYWALSYATYQTGQFRAFVVDACRLVQTTLQYGQCDISCIAYVAYVTAMSAMGKPYPLCYQMGRLALALSEQRDNKYFRLTVYQYFGPFYQHWGEPLKNTLPYLDKGLDWGQEGVNPLSAGYCALLRSVNRFALGTRLSELEQECEQGLKFLQKSHQPNTENMLRHGVLQPVLALQGKTLSPLTFDSELTRSSDFFKGDYQTPSIHLALHSCAMLRHAYLLGDQPLWQQFAATLPLIGMCLPDSPSMVEASFYVALGLLRWPGGDAADNSSLQQARALTDKFKVWAQGCRDNFQHKHVLLSAELARVDGQLEQAMELYGQAIEAAKQAGFCVCEALANELYARFWIARKQKQLATGFIRDAYYYYEAWGAKVKCLALEREWPTITFRIGEKKQATSERTRSHRKVSEQSELLDLQSLLKANQLLAEEIHLESLLRKMMGVLLENAGAEQGAIILVDGDELVVEVMGKMVKGLQIGYTRVDKPLAEVCDSDYPLLPDAIIRHVQRSHETLLLNCPADDERFSRSRYLENQQPKSVLCLPILSQGKLVALVYLENNLLENAFTVRQKKTLELLSSQMAISLVNAHLYDNLEEKVLQRTEQLRQMSMRDGLTGIANRRCFDERLDSEWRRCVRHGQPMSLLMVDIDHFKEYNDHYGHVDGDACIKAVASALAHSANRAGDFVARYGGEEFAILLSETDAEVAEQVAQACLKAVAQLQRPHHTSQCSNVVSISLGVCSVIASQQMSAEQLLKQADQALYQAKQGGRNRYCVYAPPAVPLSQ